jgi:uroporphyrinogen decarboxylase
MIRNVYIQGMTKKQRVEAVLRGEHPDHAPVSFWHHFSPEQAAGQRAVDAHLAFLEKYDVDFLKVMNDHHFPRGELTVARLAQDLKKLQPLAGDVPGFAGQLEVLRKLREHVGPDVPLCTTIFNAWAILRYLTQPPSDHHGPPSIDGQDQRDDAISAMLAEDRSAVRAGLEAIATSLANFARECIRAGADGVFLSVRDDWVNRPANGPQTYDELVRPLDLAILEAASAGTFNMLHACGRPQNFAAFASYPVHAINWADRAAGPSIAYACERVKAALAAPSNRSSSLSLSSSPSLRVEDRAEGRAAAAIAAGVDNLKTLPQGTPDDCAREVRDALRQAKQRPIIIAAGCTYDPAIVPEQNLFAVVKAAREAKG